MCVAHDLTQICKNEIRIAPNSEADSEDRLELELELAFAILSRGPLSTPTRSNSSTNCSISWITLRAENDVCLTPDYVFV